MSAVKKIEDETFERKVESFKSKTSRELDSYLNKRGDWKLGWTLAFLLGCLIIFVSAGFLTGQSAVRTQLKIDSALETQQSAEELLMDKPVNDVFDHFLKFLMVRVMRWLHIILFVLGVGWIIHGVF